MIHFFETVHSLPSFTDEMNASDCGAQRMSSVMCCCDSRKHFTPEWTCGVTRDLWMSEQRINISLSLSQCGLSVTDKELKAPNTLISQEKQVIIFCIKTTQPTPRTSSFMYFHNFAKLMQKKKENTESTEKYCCY